MTMKPHYLFFFLAIGLIACGLLMNFTSSNKAIDIPLHDTYFVISISHIVWWMVSLPLFIALIYLIGEKYQFNYNKWLTLAHFITTILFIVLFFRLLYSNETVPKQYFSSSNSEDAYAAIRAATMTLSASFCIMLFLFIINLLVGFWRRQPS